MFGDGQAFGHPAKAGSFRHRFLADDLYPAADRVTDEHGFHKAQAVIAIRKRHRVDDGGGQADADGEHHGTMGDALAKGQGLAEFGIQMMRKEIARMAGMHHEIGFGDRAAHGLAGLPDFIIFVIGDLLKHRGVP